MYEDLVRLDQGLRSYYAREIYDFPLQGDTFDGAPFPFVEQAAFELRHTRVMLLTNTCDASAENARTSPVRVTIAPLVRIQRWREVSLSEGVSATGFESKLKALKAHKVSTALYLPAGAGLESESVVFFDRIQSMPIVTFDAASPRRLATLSNQAFWLLTIKLTIHFSRLQEGVSRQAA